MFFILYLSFLFFLFVFAFSLIFCLFFFLLYLFYILFFIYNFLSFCIRHKRFVISKNKNPLFGEHAYAQKKSKTAMNIGIFVFVLEGVAGVSRKTPRGMGVLFWLALHPKGE